MFTIKKVDKTSIPDIISIAKQTWPQTYGHILSNEQLQFMLQLMYNPKVLENTFDNKGVFLIAYETISNTPLAFAAYEPYENASANTFKLQKLYSIPVKHKKGVGKLLLHTIIENIKDEGAQKLILTVNRFNSALTFYLKMGFHISERKDFHVGNGYYMNDYIMEKDI